MGELKQGPIPTSGQSSESEEKHLRLRVKQLICGSLNRIGSEVKAPPCNAGDLGLTPGSGRSLGEGNGNPLQYSCLENPIDGGPLATVHGVAKSWTRLSDFTFTFKQNENQTVLATAIHTLSRNAGSLEGAVAGSWSLGIVRQSQGEGCC